ncbi:MAG: hypothetical protein EZS28_007318 [Streblomastix strix]|uniref:Tyr recombinase domain-containing protein n=1 Tax=Streblomastix strix TaxID=222440 RepID=A0A5J4WQV0_9EUKA|nr:MAG: hypothetical protein EZS28_007318 [Streblomastix strix]
MAFLVIYTATRMIVLCRFKLQDITSSDSGLNLETEICKGGNIVQVTIRLRRHEEATPSFYYKQLTNFIRRAKIGRHYTRQTTRNAMMTKLRANGANKAEVYVLTRHSITSDVVGTFYFKSVERDLGKIIAKIEGISVFFQPLIN